MDDLAIEYQTILLQKLRYGGQHSVLRSDITHMDVEHLAQHSADMLIARLEAEVLGEKLGKIVQKAEFERPATWWDHFKLDKFPAKWLTRWPAKMVTEVQEVELGTQWAMFPVSPIQTPKDQRGPITVLKVMDNG